MSEARLSRCPICLSNKIRFVVTNEVNPFTNKTEEITIAYKCCDCNMKIEKSSTMGKDSNQIELERNIVLLRDDVLHKWNTPRIIETVTSDLIKVPV